MPTRRSPRPNAQAISVALARRDAMRVAGVTRGRSGSVHERTRWWAGIGSYGKPESVVRNGSSPWSPEVAHCAIVDIVSRVPSGVSIRAADGFAELLALRTSGSSSGVIGTARY